MYATRARYLRDLARKAACNYHDSLSVSLIEEVALVISKLGFIETIQQTTTQPHKHHFLDY